MYYIFSPIIRIHRVRYPGVEVEVVPWLPHYLAAKFFLSVATTQCSVGLETLVPKGGMLPPGDNDSMELVVNTAIHPLRVPHASESTEKEERCCSGCGDWS